MVRSSFSVLFFIRENRVRKDGTTIIEVLITVNGERCGFSTGKKVKAISFDKTNNCLYGIACDEHGPKILYKNLTNIL